MTVPSTSRRAGPFTGTGVLLSYPFTFKVFEKADVQVTIADTNGLETLLVLDSTVLVTLNVDQDATPGGSVQYAAGGIATALPTGYMLAITGEGLVFDQPAELPQGGNFDPGVIEAALDRLEMQIQLVREAVDRTLQVAVTTPTSFEATLPAPVPLTLLGWAADGLSLVNYAPDVSSAAGLQTRLANPNSPIDGDALVAVKRTISVAMAETLHNWIEGNPTLAMSAGNGFVGDGVADDTAAMNAACAALSLLGGGTLVGVRGKTYKFVSDITVADGVRVDLNRCTVNFTWANGADVSGFDMRNNTALFNGTVNGVEAGPPTSGGKELHCPIYVGRVGGALAGYSNVRLYDLTVTNNRGGAIGGRGILVQSSSNNVIVENITFPSSSTLGTAVQVSWAGPGGNPPATSEHPYNVSIRNIKIGTMTKAGSSFDVAAIDIVAGYNITVDNVSVDAWAGDAVLQIRVGGFGTTVCPAAIAPLLFKGTICSNFSIKACSQHAAIVSGIANDAVGTPVYSVPVRMHNINAVGPGLSSAYWGIRLLNCRDVEVANCDVAYFDRGIYVEENTRRINIHHNRSHHNNEQGIAAVHGTAPRDVTIADCEVWLNGQDGGSHAGIYAENVDGLRLLRNILGDETSETGQIFNMRVLDTCRRVIVEDNYSRTVKSGGACYVMGSANSYGVFERYRNNRAAAQINGSEIYSGVNIITEETFSDSGNGYPIRQMRARNAAVPPSAGTFHRGDMIVHGDPAASTSMGEACVTAGTFSAFTDNTGDTTNGSRQITGMTSTTGLLAGEYVTCSAGFASTGPFRVLSIDSATTITVDAVSNSTQANITVSTPDPVFKTMPALGA